MSIWQFLPFRNITILEQPCYSLDLALGNFYLFPKGINKETCFEDMEPIKRPVTTELRGIPEESIQQCIEALQRKIGKCIRLSKDYFEGKTQVVCCLELNWIVCDMSPVNFLTDIYIYIYIHISLSLSLYIYIYIYTHMHIYIYFIEHNRHQNNKQKLQILKALHIRNIQPKLNRINFETSANVLKCL